VAQTLLSVLDRQECLSPTARFFDRIEEVAWEDVVNLPPKSTVRIAWIPEDRPGSWMYHWHILEHHEAGMMGHFEVVR